MLPETIYHRLENLNNLFKCCFVYSILYISANCLAQTNISAGYVAGNWTKANSPYYINGEITIPNDSTLALEPGVEVIFMGHYKFNVQGRLLAVGTKQDSIKFTAEDKVSGWHGIRFVPIQMTLLK